MCDLEQQRAVFQHFGCKPPPNTNEEEYTSAGNRKRRQNRKVFPGQSSGVGKVNIEEFV